MPSLLGSLRSILPQEVIMAKQQSPKQKQIVGRVMHEFKNGELEQGAGGKVKSPRQAIAIALSEAGASNEQAASENRKRMKKTQSGKRGGKAAQQHTAPQQKERASAHGATGGSTTAGTTRAELYRRAQEAGIPGRSRMTRDELQRSLTRH